MTVFFPQGITQVAEALVSVKRLQVITWRGVSLSSLAVSFDNVTDLLYSRKLCCFLKLRPSQEMILKRRGE